MYYVFRQVIQCSPLTTYQTLPTFHTILIPFVVAVNYDGTVTISGLPVCFTSNWAVAENQGWAHFACTESGRG